MEDVVKMITQKTGISEDKARVAVEVVVGYLKGKLPGPVAGQLDDVLKGGGGISGALGSLLGKS